MQWLKRTVIVKAYLMTILVVGMTFSPTVEFVLAIALFILNLYAAYRQLPLKIDIALLLGTIILLPLTLTQLAGSILSNLFILPAIYLLDQNLKEYALTQPLKPQKRTREPTPTLKSTIITIGVILATSITLANVTLISATAILIAYFTGILSVAIIRVPKKPIQDTKTWSRLLVGNTEKKILQIHSVTKQSLYSSITPLQAWVQVKQSTYFLKSDKNSDVEVIFTPSLAGLTKIQLNVSAIDTRGLIQSTQLIEPIELHVLPRAKYSEWLAKKFLEHSGSGASALAATSLLKALKAAERSIEYYGNRPYQPGDRLREVDWKHTYMLGELTVKEFTGAHEQPIIIAVDLMAKDEQEADRLAYNMVMAALTAATECLPSGLACFNQKEVVVAAVPANPRETLKKTLKITEKTTILQKPTRIMQPIDLRMIRTIEKYGDFFSKIFSLEFEATQNIARQYPGNIALKRCLERTSAQSTIAVISVGSGDAEALGVTLKKLQKRRCNVIKV